MNPVKQNIEAAKWNLSVFQAVIDVINEIGVFNRSMFFVPIANLRPYVWFQTNESKKRIPSTAHTELSKH